MTAARRVGRYLVGERIGSGGVADVYLARTEGAEGFAKQLVLKRVRPDLADREEITASLRAEADLGRRLAHGNLVQVIDYGLDDEGCPYLVMEHVDGCSLAELRDDLRERGEAFDAADAVFVVREVAAGLRYAHRMTDEDGTPLKLVHRDVKPRNILISREGVVKLADFGIAKVARAGTETLPGVVKGTPLYLSPEQATGRPVDARTDVYALGLVLGEVAPDDDAELAAIVERATEPAAKDRHPSIDAMLDDLADYVASRGLRPGPEKLAGLVRRQRGEAPPRAAVSLDDALRDVVGDAEAHTRQVTPPPPPPPPASAGRGRLVAGGIAVGLLAGTVALMVVREDPQPPVEAGEPTRTVEPAPRPSDPEPEPAVDPEPAAPSPEHEGSTAAAVLPPDGGAEPEPEVEAEPERAPPSKPPPAPVAFEVNLLPYAYVTVDGHRLGKTPIDATLSPGRHTVVLENPDLGKKDARRIRVRPGRPVRIVSWNATP